MLLNKISVNVDLRLSSKQESIHHIHTTHMNEYKCINKFRTYQMCIDGEIDSEKKEHGDRSCGNKTVQNVLFRFRFR